MVKDLVIGKTQAFVITDRVYRKYFTGIDLAEGILLLSVNPVYFADARYFALAKEKLSLTNFTCKLLNGLACVKEELSRQGITEVLLDYETTTLAQYEEYKSFNVKLSNGTSLLQGCRKTKSLNELGCIEKACNIIEQAVSFAIDSIKLGVTEQEIASLIESKIIQLGGEGVSFPIIVAFGKNSAVPHHETGNTVLEENSVVLIDAGAKYNGYCSDITRTVYYGTPTTEFINAYEAVLSANELAIQNITQGTTCVKADEFARSYLISNHLGEYFTHSLGHGVGLEIHEAPTLSIKGKGILENGMVFTIEPGVYFENKYGIRIEDTVVLSNGSVRRLYTDDKKLRVIPKK